MYASGKVEKHISKRSFYWTITLTDGTPLLLIGIDRFRVLDRNTTLKVDTKKPLKAVNALAANQIIYLGFSGSPNWTWTSDLRINSQEYCKDIQLKTIINQ